MRRKYTTCHPCLAPNGSFEFGTTGWTLSGHAGVVAGNEPFYPTGS